jgi:hypothetical protein
MQVFAKVARRMYKLQSLLAAARGSSAAAPPPQQLLQSCDTALRDTAAWLCTERAVLDAAWLQEAQLRPGTAVVNFTDLKFREHTNHSLPAALGHLRAAMAARQSAAVVAVTAPVCAQRLQYTASMPSVAVLQAASSSEDVLHALCTVEWWVRVRLWPSVHSSSSSSSNDSSVNNSSDSSSTGAGNSSCKAACTE